MIYRESLIKVNLLILCSFLYSELQCNYCNQSIKGTYFKLESKVYHKKCYKDNIIPKCDVCKKPLDGVYIPTNQGSYHRECYKNHVAPKCGVCKKPLDKKYVTSDGGAYHSFCYTNHILPKCDICGDPLENHYNIDSWGNKYHAKHKSSPGTCSSCSRIVSKNTSSGGITHIDNRVICNICLNESIGTPGEIEQRRQNVLSILYDQGFFNLPKNIPIILVDRKKLMKLKPGNTNIKGLTNYEYSYKSNSSGQIIEESKKFKIYILDKLPRIDFDAVLAHEYLHVWLYIHNQNYKSSITEGFCNLGSYLIYSLNYNEFSEVQLNNMQNDPDPDYGVGYRNIKKCLDKKGWNEIIKNIQSGKGHSCYF